MQLGDKVKHKNMYIAGKIVKVNEDNIFYVKCDGGIYYDAADNWDLIEVETSSDVSADLAPEE